MANIKCPHCCGVFLETTEKYTLDRISNGAMFKLKEAYGINGYNWSCFPFLEETICDQLECPGCGVPMIESDGKIRAMISDTQETKELPKIIDIIKKTEEHKPDDAHVCDECGKFYSTEATLRFHIKTQHKKKAVSI